MKITTKQIKIPSTNYVVNVTMNDFGAYNKYYRFKYEFTLIYKRKVLWFTVETYKVYTETYRFDYDKNKLNSIQMHPVLINNSVNSTLEYFLEVIKTKMLIENDNSLKDLPKSIKPISGTNSHTFRHIENGLLYDVTDSCLMKTKDKWEPGVIYKSTINGKTYSRTVQDFSSRFLYTRDPKKNDVLNAYKNMKDKEKLKFNVLDYTVNYLPAHYTNNKPTPPAARKINNF